MNLTEALEQLQLDSRAGLAEVRKAYRRLSLEHHPDRVLDPEAKALAHRRFLRIRDAYEFLRARPELLRGAPRRRPADPAEAEVERLIRRYRELHAVRSTPFGNFLGRLFDEWLPEPLLWLVFGLLVAALLLRTVD